MSRMKDLLGDIPFESKEANQITRRSDPITSFEAGVRVLPRLKEIQSKVYWYLRSIGPHGLADWEIENHFGDHGATYRTRRAELVDLGLVRDTGRTRTINGRKRKVWAAQ
jgi:hypothetical protein